MPSEFVINILARDLNQTLGNWEKRFLSDLDAPASNHEYIPAGQVASCACHRYRITSERSLQDLRTLGRHHASEADIAVQPASAHELRPRLIAFDLDSTLINVEGIDELARFAGAQDQVARITEAAMRGEIDFRESFRRRIAMLKGLEEARCLALLQKLSLTDGADHIVTTLHARGCMTAILSGGFGFAADWVRRRIPIDYVLTNELPFADGCVTGIPIEPIVDGRAKATAFRDLMISNNIPRAATIAVGDGANDLPMMALAGLSVGFRAKPEVSKQCDVSLDHVGLDAILHLIAPQ